MEKINSKGYWDNRFLTNWKEFDGNEQTKYFAEILCEMLPEWLVHEVNEKRYSICDLGCAEGDALRIFEKYFMTSEIVGEDFSEKAIGNALNKYPEFQYRVSNILEPKDESKYQVVICSNVLEHFEQTYKVLENICERSEKYTVIMLPYREELGKIEEHEKNFFTKDIPMQIGENQLIYAKSMDCKSVYYPYEQIVLVYSKGRTFSLLSDITENVCGDNQLRCENQIIEYAKNNEEKEKQIIDYIRKIEEKEKEIVDYVQIISEREKTIIDYQKIIENKKNEIDELSNELLQRNERISNCIIEKDDCDNQNDLKIEMEKLKKDNSMMAAVLRQKDEYMIQAQKMCMDYAASRTMKFVHLKNRIIRQLLKGTKEERKDFWDWCKRRKSITYKLPKESLTYNPWQMTSEVLKEGIACKPITVKSPIAATINDVTNVEVSLPDEIKDILAKKYAKTDIIILSVIDYNFRYQRPQHFATRFAANGHRVFYVNANFIRPDSINKEMDNLYVVDFSSQAFNTIYAMNGQESLSWMKEKFDQLIYSQAIRDAVVVVDYPNWVYGAETLREKYGFKFVTDYMDDYTGFLGTTENFLKENCIRLLQESDAVVASSQFLFDVANKYTDREKITIVRNGTEVEHFYQATKIQRKDKKRKVIGYYGAVSHWFAWEKVCYLAKSFPEYDVVIIGDVTDYRKELEKYSNIKLLGEKSYKELPNYLVDFDVCLIPFDTSTDLIKATNPVKFYEYLSAGKKVVATEIPELMPFRDEYVYMSNDDEQFAEYVKMCIEEMDSLKETEECIEFAKENDWQHRYECFEMACSKAVPMVSIIVLTYNNLELSKKCIRSILEKTAYANYELLIVDNQSTDGTVEYLKELEEKNITNLKVIYNKVNFGFAGGNNIGIDEAKGKYVLLLNNDTIVTRGWLTSMVKHLERNPKYGMCNPVTNSIGNESQIKVEYHNEKEMHEFAYNVTAINMNSTYQRVDRLPLFSTLIKKEIINKVGKLDDSYKIGMFEDDDYTEAVKKAGYEFVIVEDAFVHHVNNASFKKLDDAEYKKIFKQNKEIFEKKWNKEWTMPHYRDGVYAEINEGMGV